MKKSYPYSSNQTTETTLVSDRRIYSTVARYLAWKSDISSVESSSWQVPFKPALGICMGDRKSWMDDAVFHRRHLVIPSVTFLFPLSQLLPLHPISLQCHCHCFRNSPWPWVDCPLCFVWGVSGLRVPPHLETHLCSDQDSTTLQCSSRIWLHLNKNLWYKNFSRQALHALFFLLPSVVYIYSVLSTIFCGLGLFIWVKVKDYKRQHLHVLAISPAPQFLFTASVLPLQWVVTCIKQNTKLCLSKCEPSYS